MVNAIDFVSEEAYNEAVAAEREEACGDGYGSNELARSFAHAKSLVPSRDQSAKIDALVAEGKYVTFCEVEINCPFTDALIRVEQHIHSIHDTYQAANDACHDQTGEFMDGMGVAMARQPEPPYQAPVSVLDVADGDPYDIPF